jgi:hypothetical protein
MNGKSHTQRVKLAILGFSTVALGLSVQAAMAQSWTPPSYTPAPHPTYPMQQMPLPQVSTPPPSMPMPPMMPPPRTMPTPINPMDVTGNLGLPTQETPENAAALNGIKVLADDSFPQPSDLQGNAEWILVQSKPDAKFERLTPYSVKFGSGEILVSVRRPSRLALVSTPYGDISLNCDSDVMLSFKDGVLRILSLNARGDVVKVRLNKGAYDQQSAKVISLAPGYEVVASDHVLKRHEVRVADGFARRHFKLIDDGKMAVSEVNAESVLNSSGLIAAMNQKETGSKERRLLSDMSKMAAVLNYVNGVQGFSAQQQGVAGTSETVAHDADKTN